MMLTNTQDERNGSRRTRGDWINGLQSAGHRALETHGGTGDTLGFERPLRGHRLFGRRVRTNNHLM